MNEYYEHPAISQSRLKLLLGKDPSRFNMIEESELYYEEKKHFVLGSAVDCILTQSMEEFQRLYHVSSLESKPSSVIMSIIQMVFDSSEEGATFNSRREAILEACDIHAYATNWKSDTRVNKVLEPYNYWDELTASRGKIILSDEEYSLISQIVMSLRTLHPTGLYFLKDTLFQKAIYFTYKGVNCKALLDMVNIDHKAKTIQPLDIKTLGGHVLDFHKSVIKRRYDIQAAFYTEALSQEYPGYEILPFKFLVESTVNPGTPLVYEVHPSLLEIGKNGRKPLVDEHTRTEEILGFNQLIELYLYYEENGYMKDQVILEHSGTLLIDWSGIMV